MHVRLNDALLERMFKEYLFSKYKIDLNNY
jgi:hypothetical protein